MPSERVQRQIDRLLDEAEQAIAADDWDTVQVRSEAVLRLDAGNADARSYLAAAAKDSGVPPVRIVAAPPVPALPASFVSGRYEVLSLLGEGGKKIVYRAYDTLLKRDVAFALIKTEGLDAAGRERVKREAQALGQLSAHPNIVSVFDLGEDEGRPFIVTELLPGGDLQRLIADAPDHKLPLPRVLEIAGALGKALAFAHGKGIIHRDLKPGNIWLAEDETPKLGDFGLALALGEAHLTQAGMMVGTALYMAPEQATGGTVTPRTDLYSLGCVLYELVTGRPPFVGDESVAIIGQHLHANAVSPSWHRPECPTALEALILRLLGKDPRKRPASTTDVVEALAGMSLTTKRTTSESRQQVGQRGPSPVYQRAFVGREQELRQLEGAFDAALSGQGGLVLVMGEPGIGKTTLTEQLATYASLRGGQTLVGHCYEEGSLSLPYLPFVEALRTYVLARDPKRLRSELGTAAPEVARIVSEVRDKVQVEPAPVRGEAGEDRYRLLQGISTFLHNAALVQPLVLVLEDLHDADRGTLDLLTFLARQLDDSRLLVVGTYRDVEVDRQHPLSGTLAELRRGSSLDRVLLRGLTADEVQRMIGAIAGQDVTWGLAEGVHRQTEGNPLFVQEVIRYLAEEGYIKRVGGRWRAASGESVLTSIPEGLGDVIGKRLARLSPACNRLLTAAAVIGRDFELATLQAVAGVEEEGLVVALEEAVRVAVLQDQSRPGVVRYRFAHAFFRQTLYDELIAPRRLRLHQQIARALEAQYASRPEEHAAELAEHFGQSTDPGDLAKAVHYAELAAGRARTVFAHGEAMRLLAQALAVQEVYDPDDNDRICSLLLALAEAMLFAGDLRTIVDEVAPRALRLAENLGDMSRASHACMLALQALGLFGSAAQLGTAEFEAWVDRLDRFAQAGTVYRVWADTQRVLSHRFSRRGADTRKLAVRALALARKLGDPAALSMAAVACLISDRPVDRRERLALANEFASLTESLADAESRVLCQFLWTTFHVAGQRGDAEEQLRRLERYVERSGDGRTGLFALAERAFLATLDGRFEDALALGDTIRALGEELGSPVNGMQAARQLRPWPLLQLGRTEEALQDLELSVRIFGGFLPPNLAAMRVLGLTQAGRTSEARAELADFRASLRTRRQESIESQLGARLTAAIAVGEAEVGNVVAEELTRDVDCAETIHLLTGTCTARHLGALAALNGDRDEAKRRYAQARDVAARNQARPETAMTRLQLAELLADGDNEERAEVGAHLAFCIPEFEAMRMAPALARAHSLQARLTPPSPLPAEEAMTHTASAPVPDPHVGHVFISYSSDDRPLAFALEAKLQAEGFAVWLDKRSIAAGSSWDAAIVEGIKQSAIVAVFVSPKAVASDNVRQELRLALQYKKPILPLLLAPTAFPGEVEYVLTGRQWIDLTDRTDEDGFADVLAAIQRLV